MDNMENCANRVRFIIRLNRLKYLYHIYMGNEKNYIQNKQEHLINKFCYLNNYKNQNHLIYYNS